MADRAAGGCLAAARPIDRYRVCLDPRGGSAWPRLTFAQAAPCPELVFALCDSARHVASGLAASAGQKVKVIPLANAPKGRRTATRRSRPRSPKTSRSRPGDRSDRARRLAPLAATRLRSPRRRRHYPEPDTNHQLSQHVDSWTGPGQPDATDLGQPGSSARAPGAAASIARRRRGRSWLASSFALTVTAVCA